MSEHLHREKGFLKDRLGNYRVDPPEKVWEAISGQIDRGRKRRGIYILLLATAASIALAISLGIYFSGPDLSTEQALEDVQGQKETMPERVIQQKKEPSANASTDLKPLEITEDRPVLAVRGRPVMEEVVELESEPGENEWVEIQQPEASSDPEAMHLPENEEVQIDSRKIRDRESDLLSDSALEMNPDPLPGLDAEKKRKSRWMVGAALSPLYSYRDADAKAMAAGPDESGLLAFSTGVHVRYQRNSRLSLETGIYYNRTGIEIGAGGIKILSRNIDNMVFGAGSESADINTVNNSVGNIIAHSGDIYVNGYKISGEKGGDALEAALLNDVQVAESGIQQHLDYLELPFNLRYSVIERVFELQLVGGISTNFLVGNSVTMESASGREEIGYLSSVNKVNYSGNAGLGMIYHMGRKMSLFLEPRFRYFLNSVNDASLPATRPYSLGFYTGLSYTF